MEFLGSFQFTWRSMQFTRQSPAPGTHGLCAFAFSYQAGAGRVATQPHRHLRSRGMTKAHPALMQSAWPSARSARSTIAIGVIQN